MTKSELVAKMAAKYPHLRRHEVRRMVDKLFEEISKALEQGDRVELRGFGNFSVKQRNSRRGRNPRTGEAVSVDEKFVPFFKTGKNLRDILKQM